MKMTVARCEKYLQEAFARTLLNDSFKNEDMKDVSGAILGAVSSKLGLLAEAEGGRYAGRKWATDHQPTDDDAELLFAGWKEYHETSSQNGARLIKQANDGSVEVLLGTISEMDRKLNLIMTKLNIPWVA